MKYQIIGKLNEQKYKSCDGLNPMIWEMIKDKVYVLHTYETLEWAEWRAKGLREDQSSNLDIDTIEIIEVK